MLVVPNHSMHVKPQRRHTDDGHDHPEHSGSDPTIVLPQNGGISNLGSHPQWARPIVKAFFRAFGRSKYYSFDQNDRPSAFSSDDKTYNIKSTISGKEKNVGHVQFTYGHVLSRLQGLSPDDGLTKRSPIWIRISIQSRDGVILLHKEWRKGAAPKPRQKRFYGWRTRRVWSGRRPKWRKFGVHILHLLQQHEMSVIVHHVMDT